MDILGKTESLWRKLRFILKRSYYLIRYRRNLFFGQKCMFYKDFYLFAYGNIFIGDNCFFNDGCSLNCLKLIKIGNNCMFGKNVNMYDHNHIYGENIIVKDSGFESKDLSLEIMFG